MARPRGALFSGLRHDSAFWRRALTAGVTRGPDPLVRHSPPLFGVIFAAALPELRRRVEENLRRVRGPRSRLIDLLDSSAVFAAYGSCITEALLLASDRGYTVVRRSRGVEHYHACAAAGRGVIIVTAHTGGWDIAGQILGVVHPAGVMLAMQRERDAEARAIQDAARQRAGVQVVHIGEGPLDALPLLKHLQRGGAVAIQIDRAPPGMRSREVTFLGGRWRAPEGPIALAAMSGAPILPVFTHRLGFLDYEAVVAPPIRLARRATEEERDAAAAEMMGALERFVRAHPTQWFHFSGDGPVAPAEGGAG
ncbi:lysophospholipid acyltransferase family protein [Sorangium atrum]|uniref:Lysophospholipid acyltransferase family protein n=1 Tax=Sorangium atrum TaxID=2995308 RepID=A0ABT5C8C2_9BACT|nr:lysophospholipid acyltransferase family protein [Sorangium aterium]MDC0682203.1 lysophospholipid acyltransferase family protein [Sorangium aterium]